MFEKIDELFEQSISEGERIALAKLVYYPETELNLAKQNGAAFSDWCRITIYRLVEICKEAASKYTRSKVRKNCLRTSPILLMSFFTPMGAATSHTTTAKL